MKEMMEILFIKMGLCKTKQKMGGQKAKQLFYILLRN